MNKLENLIDVTKLNEILGKKEQAKEMDGELEMKNRSSCSNRLRGISLFYS